MGKLMPSSFQSMPQPGQHIGIVVSHNPSRSWTLYAVNHDHPAMVRTVRLGTDSRTQDRAVNCVRVVSTRLGHPWTRADRIGASTQVA